MKWWKWAAGAVAAYGVGVVMGWMAAAAGTGLAMRNAMDLRDEQRDRMAAGLQNVIDTAAADLADMRDQLDQAQAELEAVTPKDVRNAPTV